GSGKTTMMMVIAGLERPSAGQVVVAGQDLGGLGEDQLARLRRDHVGIVFQAFHLIPTMSALENVAVPLELARRRWRRSASASDSPTIPASFRAASSSAWRWPAPRRSVRGCCSPTSRPAI